MQILRFIAIAVTLACLSGCGQTSEWDRAYSIMRVGHSDQMLDD